MPYTGGDGIKIRDKDQGKLFYINFCCHEAIESPTDLYTNRILHIHDLFKLRDMNGLQIPLIVGIIRNETVVLNDDIKFKSHCNELKHNTNISSTSITSISNDVLVVDIVFNPIIIEACLYDSSSYSKQHEIFKEQIIELGCQWVIDETKVTFHKNWICCKESYSYGRGTNKLTPTLFSVSYAMEQNKNHIEQQQANASNDLSSKQSLHKNTSDNKNNKCSIQSTSSLLNALKNEKYTKDDYDSNDDDVNINLLNNQKAGTKQNNNVVINSNPHTNSGNGNDKNLVNKSVLIQDLSELNGDEKDLDNQTNDDLLNVLTSTKEKEAPPLMKKGFLSKENMRNKSIYPPEGS